MAKKIEYIRKDKAIEYAQWEGAYKVVMCLEEMKAADVQPVIETENVAIVSDEFICKECGIHIKNFIKVVMEEDNSGYIDERHYDYEPKFCPECGAKIKNVKLKPCPFCESEAVMTYSKKGFQVFCDNDDCILNSLEMIDKTTEQEAAEAWNRRASNDT